MTKMDETEAMASFSAACGVVMGFIDNPNLVPLLMKRGLTEEELKIFKTAARPIVKTFFAHRRNRERDPDLS